MGISECSLEVNVVDARCVKKRSTKTNLLKCIIQNAQFSNWSSENKNYTKFLAQMKSLWKICDDDSIKIMYKDEDNDEIPIECDDELREAIKFATFSEIPLTIIIRRFNHEDDCDDRIENDCNGDSMNLNTFGDNDCEEQKQKKMCSDSVKVSSLVDEDQMKCGHVFEALRGSNDKYGCVKKINSQQRNEQFNERALFDRKLCRDYEKLSKDGFSELNDINDKSLPVKGTLTSNAEYSECLPPQWFIHYMTEVFEPKMFSKMENLLDDKLSKVFVNGRILTRENKTDITDLDEISNTVNAFAINDLNNYGASKRKLKEKYFQQLEKVCEKEKRLDKKIELKKKKIVNKLMKTGLNSINGDHSEELDKRDYLFPDIDNGTKQVRDVECIVVQPNEIFFKILSIKNNSEVMWTCSTMFRHDHSEEGLKPLLDETLCAGLGPKEIKEIPIPFQAPDKEGFFHSYWVVSHDGFALQQHVVQIKVEKHLSETDDKESVVYSNKNGIASVSESSKQHQTKDVDGAIDLSLKSPVPEQPTISQNSDKCSSDSSDEGSLGSFEPVFASDDSSENNNTDDRNEKESFVVIPMPRCFFPDAPSGDEDTVSVKVKRKLSSKRKGNNEKQNMKVDIEKAAAKFNDDRKVNFDDVSVAPSVDTPEKNYKNCEPVESVEVDEAIEGSIYMVDNSGICFLVEDDINCDGLCACVNVSCEDGFHGNNSTRSEDVTKYNKNQNCDFKKEYKKSVNDKLNIDEQGKCFTNLEKSNKEVPFIIRDKNTKCVFLDHYNKQFSLPGSKTEKVYLDDPKYEETKFITCKDVVVKTNGVIAPYCEETKNIKNPLTAEPCGSIPNHPFLPYGFVQPFSMYPPAAPPPPPPPLPPPPPHSQLSPLLHPHYLHHVVPPFVNFTGNSEFDYSQFPHSPSAHFPLPPQYIPFSHMPFSVPPTSTGAIGTNTSNLYHQPLYPYADTFSQQGDYKENISQNTGNVDKVLDNAELNHLTSINQSHNCNNSVSSKSKASKLHFYLINERKNKRKASSSHKRTKVVYSDESPSCANKSDELFKCVRKKPSKEESLFYSGYDSSKEIKSRASKSTKLNEVATDSVKKLIRVKEPVRINSFKTNATSVGSKNFITHINENSSITNKTVVSNCGKTKNLRDQKKVINACSTTDVKSRPITSKVTFTGTSAPGTKTYGEKGENNLEQAEAVHILPEGIVNGAVNIACSAYSKVISGINAAKQQKRRAVEEPADGDILRMLGVLKSLEYNNLEKNLNILWRNKYVLADAIKECDRSY